MDEKNEALNKWKQMMHNRCTESPENSEGEITCVLDTGTVIHTGITCTGCRYDGPGNTY